MSDFESGNERIFLLHLYQTHRQLMWAVAFANTESSVLAEEVMVLSMFYLKYELKAIMALKSPQQIEQFIYMVFKYQTVKYQREVEANFTRDVIFMRSSLGLSDKQITDIVGDRKKPFIDFVSPELQLEEIENQIDLEITDYKMVYQGISQKLEMGIPSSMDKKIIFLINGKLEPILENSLFAEKRCVRRTNLFSFKPAIAAILVLCIGISSLFIVNPNTAVAVKNFLYQTTKIPIFNSEGNKEGVLLWKNGKGVPSYVPVGCQLVESTIDEEGIITLHYEAKKEYLTIKVYPQNYHVDIDNENAIREEDIQINGAEGLLIEKDGVIALVWFADQRAYRIKTTLPEDEVIKVAESI